MAHGPQFFCIYYPPSIKVRYRWVYSQTGEAGKNAKTGYMRWSPVCPYRKQWVAKGKISIYIVKGIFQKSVLLQGRSAENLEEKKTW
jgi:hypothetical protein